MKKDYNLSILLGFIILITNFIVITPILFLQYQSSSSIFRENLINNFDEEFKLSKLFLESEFSNLHNQTKRVSENLYIRESLESNNESKIKKSLEDAYNYDSSSDFLALSYEDDRKIIDVSINILETNEVLSNYIKNYHENRSSLISYKGLLVYFTSHPITSHATGRVLGTLHSGLLLNKNTDLTTRIAEKLTHKTFNIVYEKRLISGTRPIKQSILDKIHPLNEKELIPIENKIYYKSILNISNVKLELLFISKKNIIQNLRVSFLKTFLFTIIITIILSISAATIANKSLLPPLNRLLAYLENSIKDEELKIHHRSTIKEFNLISDSFSTVFVNFQKKKNQLSRYIESSNLPTLIWDKDHKLLQYNDSAQLLFGIKKNRDNIVNDTLLSKCFKLSQLIEQAQRGEQINNEEVIFKSFDEWKYTSWTMSYDPEEKTYFAQCFDNTEKVHASKKIEEERSNTIHNQKLAALGEVAGSIAHEVNNPMGVISLSLALLESELKLIKMEETKANIIKSYLTNIDDSVQRTTTIVSHFLDFSRDSKKDKQVVREVNQIIKKSLIFIEEKVKRKKISLKLKIEDGSQCFIKETQFSQVMINLINNSIDALENAKQKEIIIEAFTDEEFCYLNFKDTGPGIPKDIIESIFTPFYTTKAQGKGTGLGLSISKSIIIEMGGTLELVKSISGAHFVIKLPKSPS
ncbi:ATP-binding protein [Halobacteriovorax sp. HLS]|uniref:PAS domain-containing sensor histidine kinase n=1 Tax=Halobacteriovorax sp. HLS TaxID=2234000 RepID=UPI000FD86455|nr:ATP-binding protein [Halobacteriovorax sp. HLS]